MIYPILKKHSESLSLGYVAARIFEGFFYAGCIIALLSILSLSREFVSATAPVVSYFETSGSLLLAELDWNSLLLDFPFVLSALILNYVLYKSKLIPRWLIRLGIYWRPNIFARNHDRHVRPDRSKHFICCIIFARNGYSSMVYR